MNEHAKTSLVPPREQLPSGSKYELVARLASGGMGTVYIARRSGAHGFSREVAIKRAHSHLVGDQRFTEQLIREAKLAARVRHSNVVAVESVEVLDGEVLLVMEFVDGLSLEQLQTLAEESGRTLPANVAVSVVVDIARGLEAVHGARNDRGQPLELVHRDVSPHNVMVGRDGVARLTDFGIAKANQASEQHARTSTGLIKGKVSYMTPEYLERGEIDASSDVYALAVTAWEALTGRRLFRGKTDIDAMRLVMKGDVPRLSSIDPKLAPFDDLFARALSRFPEMRIATARELGDELERCADAARCSGSHRAVADFVTSIAGQVLDERRARWQQILEPSSPVTDTFGRTGATKTLDSPIEQSDDAPAQLTTRDVMPPTIESAPPPAPRTRRGLVAALVGTTTILFGAGVWWARSAAIETPLAPATAEAVRSNAPVESVRGIASTLPPASANTTASANVDMIDAEAPPGDVPTTTSATSSKGASVPTRRKPPTSRDKAPPNPYQGK